ncbi:MAG TPA: condensation domain-containing protein [Candidatus Bathyarchaeia archaeon]|nr:condensation domain-containing protein [Candidatus Bathyarchaeia archaeon]
MQTARRKLDPAEYFFWLADRVSCRNFAMFAELAGELDPEAVAAALRRAQHRHPALRRRFAVARSEVWLEPTGDAPIGLRCVAAADADWRPLIERELATPFAPEDAAPMRCLYAVLPGEPKAALLALTFHHSVADGRSAAALLSRLLAEAISGDDPGADREAEFPPLHEGFPIVHRLDSPSLEGMGAARRDRQGDEQERLARLKCRLAPVIPRIEAVALPPDATQRLLSACRREATTMQGALGAAQLLATREILGTAAPGALLLAHALDMRPYLEPAVPGDCLGLYSSILSASYELGEESSFWDLARQIGGGLRRQIARGEAYYCYSLARLFYALQPPAGLATGSLLTNIGAIAPVPGGDIVRTISFALAPMPNQLSVCSASSYAGRLLANLNFDGAVTPPREAACLATAFRRCLDAAAST